LPIHVSAVEANGAYDEPFLKTSGDFQNEGVSVSPFKNPRGSTGHRRSGRRSPGGSPRGSPGGSLGPGGSPGLISGGSAGILQLTRTPASPSCESPGGIAGSPGGSRSLRGNPAPSSCELDFGGSGTIEAARRAVEQLGFPLSVSQNWQRAVDEAARQLEIGFSEVVVIVTAAAREAGLVRRED